METIKLQYILTSEACDEIAGKVSEFCNGIGAESKDVLRYRLSVEDCLLHWLDNGLSGNSVELTMGKYMFSPYIQIEIEGASVNPYEMQDDELGNYADTVLTRLDLKPDYSYRDGKNIIRFKVKKKAMGEMTKMGISFAIAVIIAVAGLILVPEGIRGSIQESLINPVCNLFYKVLGCIAGPMIFLSVISGICGMGDTKVFGKIGKKVVVSYVIIIIVVTSCAAVFFPFIGPGLSSGSNEVTQIGSMSESLIGLIPTTIIEPFATGNIIQIILMANAVGIAILYLGASKTDLVIRFMEQVNTIIQHLMERIGSLLPYIIAFVIIDVVWGNDIASITSTWKALLALLIAFVLTLACFIMVTSFRLKANPILLLQKIFPVMVVGFSTAATASTLGTTIETCKNDLGIKEALVKFGGPLGVVIHKPINAIYYLIIVFYFAGVYNTQCSPMWIATAVALSIIVSISMPPVAGGGAVVYSIIFPSLGIPMEAVALAIALDVITDFFVTAFEVALLPLTLSNVSYDIKMIDMDVFRSDLTK